MFFTDPFRELDQLAGDFFRGLKTSIPLAAWRGEDSLRFEFQVPGAQADELDLKLDGRYLTLTVDRPYREGKGTELVNEHTFGVSKRTIRIGEAVESDSLVAELVDGVLIVGMKLKAEAAPASIAIKVPDALESTT